MKNKNLRGMDIKLVFIILSNYANWLLHVSNFYKLIPIYFLNLKNCTLHFSKFEVRPSTF